MATSLDFLWIIVQLKITETTPTFQQGSDLIEKIWCWQNRCQSERPGLQDCLPAISTELNPQRTSDTSVPPRQYLLCQHHAILAGTRESGSLLHTSELKSRRRVAATSSEPSIPIRSTLVEEIAYLPLSPLHIRLLWIQIHEIHGASYWNSNDMWRPEP